MDTRSDDLAQGPRSFTWLRQQSRRPDYEMLLSLMRRRVAQALFVGNEAERNSSITGIHPPAALDAGEELFHQMEPGLFERAQPSGTR